MPRYAGRDELRPAPNAGTRLRLFCPEPGIRNDQGGARRGAFIFRQKHKTNFAYLPADQQNLPDLPATVMEKPRQHKKARIRFKKKRLALRVAILSVINLA